MKTKSSFLKQDEAAHAREHSIEVQLPFLQRVLGEFSLIPISLAHISIEECVELGTAVADLLRNNRQSGTRTIMMASSDLSHYLSPKETAELDGIALEQVLALNPRALIAAAERENITMCGLLPTAVLLFAANRPRCKASMPTQTLPFRRRNSHAQGRRLRQRSTRAVTANLT